MAPAISLSSLSNAGALRTSMMSGDAAVPIIACKSWGEMEGGWFLSMQLNLVKASFEQSLDGKPSWGSREPADPRPHLCTPALAHLQAPFVARKHQPSAHGEREPI